MVLITGHEVRIGYWACSGRKPHSVSTDSSSRTASVMSSASG